MRRVTLGDVAFEAKNTFQGDRTNVPVIGLDHLDSSEVSLTRWDCNTKNTFTKGFQKGHVLLGRRRSYLKKAAIAPFDGICSGDITVIASINGKILPELLPFVIQNDRFFAFTEKGSAGSLSPRVKWDYLKNYEFELPPLEEQRKLADLLWAAYELKESYKKLLAATDEMVKAKFIEMFGTYEDNRWNFPIRNLHEIAKYYIGLTYKPEAISNDGVIVLRSGNIQNGLLDLNDLVRVNMKIKDDLYVRHNDILMCSRNGSSNLVGKVAKITNINEPMSFGAFMTIIRSKMPEYLFSFFESDSFRNQISHGKSSIMNQITQKMLDDIRLPVPTNSKSLIIFSKFVKQADESKTELKAAIEKLEQVMRSLLP